MSTCDHYNDLPKTLPDEVRDGRQLMNGDYRMAFKEWAALQASLMVGYVEYVDRVLWTQINLGAK